MMGHQKREKCVEKCKSVHVRGLNVSRVLHAEFRRQNDDFAYFKVQRMSDALD